MGIAGCRSDVTRTTETGTEQQPRSPYINRMLLHYFVEGSVREMQQDYQGAIRQYQRALELDATHAPSYYALAKNYYQLKEEDSVLANAGRAIALAPGNAAIHNLMASALLAKGMFDSAAAEYEQVIRIEPNNLQARFMVGRIWQRRNPARAIEQYEYIRRYITEDFDVLINLAELYMNQKNYSNAAEVLKQATLLFPDSHDLYRLLSDTYIQQGLYNQAALLLDDVDAHVADARSLERFYTDRLAGVSEEIQQWSAHDSAIVKYAWALTAHAPAALPNSMQINFRSGIMRYRLGDTIAADMLLANALADTNATTEMWTKAANIYLDGNAPRRMIAVLAPYAQRNDIDYRVPYYIGLGYTRLEQYDSAEAYLMQSVKLNEWSSEAWGELGKLYRTLGRNGEAIRAFERSITGNPYNTSALSNYALLLITMDVGTEKALMLARRAVDIEPENETLLETLGWVYYKNKDYDQALRYITEAIDAGGARPETVERLGDIYQALGNLSYARDAYQRALQANPEDAELLHKLEQVQ